MELRDIPGYEGLYQVTDTGLVFGVKKQGYLSNIMDTKGYYKVKLYKDGTCKDFRVHRLVALAFLPNPHNYPMVNHKDENKCNNCVDNLEWCDDKYNT